ncbi:RNA methyltransferase [Halobacteriales archaeon QS_1_68_20]|nr:MAG: RNA methyltransferase [Halobacteriales archaeon QS_1_68_20]
MDKRRLERRLSDLAGFESPRADLEQYPTPAWLAAHLVHLADLQGDVGDRTVVDLGTGTGILALAATTRRPGGVLAVERDPGALAVARENERAFDPPVAIDWMLGDATRLPLKLRGATVLMNPPFGAQTGNEGADRAFLATAAELAAVSYSIHNEGSWEFVASFAGDNGGEVTQAFAAELAVDRQFEFHDSDREELPVEVFRIEWGGA